MVTIKGTGYGLLLHLGDGSLETVLREMTLRLESKASFFLGGRAALRVGDRALSSGQLAEIGALLQGMGVTLWAVESSHPETLLAAQELGLETSLTSVAGPVETAAQPGPREDLPGIVVRRTLRSGQALRSPGHITLIGDVNPGAEVVAGGDIVVWGKLRGTAHAGAMGDSSAVVCALQLAPSQIRIGSLIARPPDRGRPPRTPEMASVQQGEIIVERWTT